MTSRAGYLRLARDLILEKGWVQYTFNVTNGYCMFGALHSVTCRHVSSFYDRNILLSDMQNALCDTVSALKDSNPTFTSIIQWNDTPERTSIIQWNDTPERTRDEVIAVFDQTIANVLEAEILNG